MQATALQISEGEFATPKSRAADQLAQRPTLHFQTVDCEHHWIAPTSPLLAKLGHFDPTGRLAVSLECLPISPEAVVRAALCEQCLLERLPLAKIRVCGAIG